MPRKVETLVDQTTGGSRYFKAAWENYHSLVLSIAAEFSNPSLLEIGGGRLPSLKEHEIADLSGSYTVNDIDPHELELAPTWAGKLLGDVADRNLLGDSKHDHSFDFAFSHMVFEHVERPAQAYANIARLLKPGGVLMNFVPTLYASPFVLNRLLPEKVAHKALSMFFPDRDLSEAPKFPAFYRWCSSLEGARSKIADCGFSDVKVFPFYGHDYYKGVPVLRTIEEKWWPIAENRQIRAGSTYALIVCEV